MTLNWFKNGLMCLTLLLLPAIGIADDACTKLLNTKPARSNKLTQKKLFARYPEQKQIVDDLAHGQIVQSEVMRDHGGAKAILYKVTVYNSKTQRTRRAIFKPRLVVPKDEPEYDFNRTFMDVVAFRINLFLEMDIVPPAVYRTDIHIPHCDYTKGALIYFIDDLQTLKDRNDIWKESQQIANLIYDDSLLAVLTQDIDRHFANVGFGRHWAIGEIAPVAWDWSAGLKASPKDDGLILWGTDLEYGVGSKYELESGHVRQHTYERLKAATREDILFLISPLVVDRASREKLIQAWFETRDEIERLKVNDDSLLIP